jgi:hypothetical protein
LTVVRGGYLLWGCTLLYRSPLGNILMLERRVMNYTLVLTCEDGLVEIDLSALPDRVTELSRAQPGPGVGIVGRIDGGAFAVTRGRVEPWGLADVTPALLVGSPNQSLQDLNLDWDTAPTVRTEYA